jgi:hypothetical protein
LKDVTFSGEAVVENNEDLHLPLREEEDDSILERNMIERFTSGPEDRVKALVVLDEVKRATAANIVVFCLFDN